MPLRDHFRPPLDEIASWEGAHGGWPMEIVRSLSTQLPPEFLAEPRVHRGPFVEIDVATLERLEHDRGTDDGASQTSSVVWSPPKPTRRLHAEVLDQDEYEVRVYDRKRNRRLVGAIELVSPANKDRPEHRRAFVSKCLALLQRQVSLILIDIVTTRTANLLEELFAELEEDARSSGRGSAIYAAACRSIFEGDRRRVESWDVPLELGQRLPTLPLWLAAEFSVPVNFEESYEETCRVLRLS
jgi:hypothetical protein